LVIGGRQVGDAQAFDLRYRHPGGGHSFEAGPDSVLLAHLMGLEVIHVPKTDGPVEDYRTLGHRGLEEPRAGFSAHHDRVEAIVLGHGRPTRPAIGGDHVGGLANGIGADLAAGLDTPAGLISPHILVGDLDSTAVLGLDPGRPGIAVAAIAEQAQLFFLESEAIQHVLGLLQVRRAAAGECQTIAHEFRRLSVDTGQVSHGTDIARFGDDGQRAAARENGVQVLEHGGGTVARRRRLEHGIRCLADGGERAHGSVRRATHVQH
jgi:hypothetical protein